MKFGKINRFVLASLAALSLGLAACSNNEGDSDSQNQTNAVGTPAEDNLSKEEVLAKVQTASEEIKSAEVTTDVTMDLLMNEQTNKVETTATVQYTTDPLVSKTETIYFNAGEEETITTYMDETALYVQLPGSDQWITQTLSEMGIDPQKQMAAATSTNLLRELEGLMEQVTVDENDDAYVLSFEGSGDELKELVVSILATENTGADAASMADDLEINAFSYKVEVDKATFYPISFETDMDYEADTENFTMTATQQQKGSYSQINEIDTIELPADVQ
ncbi:DUF6612 family protein [Enterococcus olivae]